MKEIKPFNRLEITSNEFTYLQDSSQDESRSRLLDGTYTPGIVIPAAATPQVIANGASGIFPITSPAANYITVGGGTIATPSLHIAYDKYGERIELPALDDSGTSPTWDGDAPMFTTNTLGGWNGATPFSTGRINVPASGSILTTGTRYVFVSYVPVVETVQLPPNHEGANGNVAGVSSRRLPVTSLDQKIGKAYAHHRINGYRIYVADSSQVDNISSGAVPTLKASVTFPGEGEDSTAALYIGKYTWTNGVGVNSSTIVSGSDTLDKRPLMYARGNAVGKVGDKSVASTMTSTYIAGMMSTIQEHIGAVGDGIVGPGNAHGAAINNITNGTANPLQSIALDDGIIDLSTTNNPIGSSVLRGSITLLPVLDYLIPASGVIYQKGPAGQETYLPLGTGVSGIFSDYVAINTPPSSTKPLYLGGIGLTAVDPTQYKTSSAIPVVGFNKYDSRDVSGTWTVFARAMNQATNPGYMTLGKSLTSAGLGVDDFPICNIYWDATAGKLSRTKPKQWVGTPTSVATIDDSVEDLRNFEIISKPQISTEAMGHPVSGMFAKQAFYNQAANGDFGSRGAVLPTMWGFPAFTGKLVASEGIAWLSNAEITNTVDGSEFTGPKTNKALKVILLRDGATQVVRTRYSTYVSGLKRNTTYTISAWIYPDANACLGLVIGARFGSYNGAANYTSMPANVATTVPSALAYVPFVFDRAATGWRRVAITIDTNNLPDLALDYSDSSSSWLDLFFEGANVPSVAYEIRLTNVVVVEGDWCLNAGPKVYSGEIFMWDQSDSCPPGSIQTQANGRYLLGANPGYYSAGALFGAAQVNATFNTTPTTPTLVADHVHTLQPDGNGFGWEGSGISNVTYGAGGHDHGSHIHSSTPGAYSLLLCRRL